LSPSASSTGFGWIIGERDSAQPGTSECVLVLTVTRTDEVNAVIDRARRAGSEIVTEPDHKPWGYVATFADPDGHVWMVHTDPHRAE
jgi:uncharacterized glyoxalase superfamily protein PhnB